MKRPVRKPMWVVKDGAVIRLHNMPGFPPAPHVEGKITYTGGDNSDTD